MMYSHDKFYTGIAIGLLFSCLAMVANIVVVVIIYKKKRERTTFDLAISSLCITDLLASLCSIVFAAYGITVHVYTLQRKAGKTIHKISNQASLALDVAYFFFFLSLLHVMLITGVRVCATFWPIKFRHSMTRAVMKKLIVAAWISSIIIVPILLKKTSYSYAFGVIIFASGGLVCTAYMLITIKIFHSLKKRQFDWKKEHRVLLNSFGVTISYFACLSPLAYNQLGSINTAAFVWSIHLSIVAINFLLDPILYFYFSYFLSKKDERRRNRVLSNQGVGQNNTD